MTWGKKKRDKMTRKIRKEEDDKLKNTRGKKTRGKKTRGRKAIG